MLKFSKYQSQASSSGFKVQKVGKSGTVRTIVDGFKSMALADKVAGQLGEAQSEFATENGFFNDEPEITTRAQRFYHEVYADGHFVGTAKRCVDHPGFRENEWGFSPGPTTSPINLSLSFMTALVVHLTDME